jgi:hypothetical protein
MTRDGLSALSDGDFLTAARRFPPDQWEHWASLALIGRPEGALDALPRFTTPEVRFYLGAAAWMAGDDDYALHLLAGCPGEHAARLAALISKAPIIVAAQLPWARGGPWNVVGELADPTFRLHNISFHPSDVPNRPYADARTLLPAGVQADFYIAGMIEWHLIPPNIRELGCPILGHSGDFDLHIQAVTPWLSLFDEIVVLDRTEWKLMKGLVDVPVSVYPKSFGVPRKVPRLVDGARPIDLFLSGTVIYPYHPDKEELIVDILGLDGLSLRMVNGFESEGTYYSNLGSAKICCTYVRHPGAMPTRGLEALAMGCVVAVQEECGLREFIGDDGGVIAYGAERGALAATVRNVLRNWGELRDRALKGAAIVRRDFDLRRVASQYLRFLSILAARPRPARTGPDPAILVQKRPILQKGWLPTYTFGGALLSRWGEANVERFVQVGGPQPSATILNDIARELVLMGYHDEATSDEPAWLPRAESLLNEAIARFPRALVPRLNAIRLLLHFGNAQSVRRGLDLLDRTLSVAAAEWKVDPLDDVMPWDFCPTLFNYRAYFDRATQALAGAGAEPAELVPLILAALCNYRARYAHDLANDTALELAAAAVRWDPAFSEYLLYYIRLLLARCAADDFAEARRLLQNLALRSARLLEILDLARQVPGVSAEPWYSTLELLAERFWRTTEMREYHPDATLRPAAVPPRVPGGGRPGIVTIPDA